MTVASTLWIYLDHFRVFPCWVVYGKVGNFDGKPIENADVAIRLGIAAESSVVSARNGTFLVMTSVPLWSVCKGAKPSISVSKKDYKEYWEYIEEWQWGLKITNTIVKLRKQ